MIRPYGQCQIAAPRITTGIARMASGGGFALRNVFFTVPRALTAIVCAAPV